MSRAGAPSSSAAVLGAALAALLSSADAAGAADDGRIERERIARERAEAHRRYAAQEAACRERFVVAACIDDARAERREALDHLRAQQRVLDEADRRRRAAERMQAIRDQVERAPSPRADPLHGAATGAGPQADRPAPDGGERAARERAAIQKYEARQREAERRREEHARRVEERARKRKPAAPLPIPESASAPERPRN